MKEYPSLAAVCHQVVTNAPSGLDAATIAELLGKKYATMMSETSRQPGHKLGADMILPIMDICDSDLPLTILARQRGGVYIPLPKAAEDPAPLMKQLAASVKEFGEFAAETAKDISDGDIPKDQLDRIIKEGHEAVEAILGMITLARKTHEEQYK
ncbi:MAG: transcriptional regulator [Desulfovibrio sp.]|jgi:hypothetical protein|nr:transcriptional regulator [Desulfovibrio sp.]